MTQKAPERLVHLDQLERQPLPGLDHPIRLRFSLDGSALTYLASADGTAVRGLWRHELATGERRLILDPPAERADPGIEAQDELRRQRQRQRGEGIGGYERAARADVTLAVHAGRPMISRNGRPATALAGAESVAGASISVDGRRVAWVRDGDLWISDLAAGTRERLTSDAADGRFNGLAEYIAAEELDRYEGCWWGDDVTSLAFAHVDETAVPVVRIDHPGTRPAKHEEHRYPFAGSPNARVELRVATLDVAPATSSRAPSNRVAWQWRVAQVPIGDGYLARVVRHPHGGWLVAVLPRDQRSLAWWRLLSDGSASALWTERSEPWLTLDEATRVLSDGRILRATEASGFRHLELREADGSRPRRLTSGSWVVTELVHVDERRGEALVIGTADGVLERHLYAVPLDATRPSERPTRLTREPGWHEVVTSDDGEQWADTWSDRRTAPAVTVHARDGGTPRLVHAPSASAASLDLAVPELLEIPAEDGTPLETALFPAAGAEQDTAPPAVVWVYGGPHSQYVREAWDLTMQPLRQALARAGFAVVVADNRGTANRGLRFEAAIAGALGSVEVADQVRVVRELARRGELDPARVAITGGSFGGFMTVMAMLQEPDLFRAGVASAPVVDWDGYDTAYTERYLGTPAARPDAYAASSLLSRVANLRGMLLVLHGAIDENVHLRHSRRLVDALEAVGSRLDLVVLPDQRHIVRSPEALRARDRLAIAHLCASLGQPLPADLATEAEPEGQAAS